jgi:lipid-A-disaccharide synthase
MKSVLIVAGETSGDLHGANLMKQMNAQMPGLVFHGIGGTLMINEGLKAIRHVREMNFMGFAEVIRHLPFIRKTFSDMENLMDELKPSLAILIDYPGFNLRLAKMLKEHNIPVMYYISPQLWAWHKSRVKLVKKYIDRMVVLFDFEKDFYREHGIEADFVGHPLIDVVGPSEDRESFRSSIGVGSSDILVGLFPGSRKQEVIRILPHLVGSVAELKKVFQGLTAVIGCASEIDNELYKKFTEGTGIICLRDKTYDIMSHSDALVVTSGTATLEAGISGVPTVIVYRTSGLTFFIGKALVKIPNIGLINIIAGSRIVPELWQDDVTPSKIAAEISLFLKNGDLCINTRKSLAEAVHKLGGKGASERAAKIALSMIK